MEPADAVREAVRRARPRPGLLVAAATRDAETGVASTGPAPPGSPGCPPDRAVFEIGSVTKVFTALLLAVAVERGEARLDDPVAAQLPHGARVPEGKAGPVTLLHLATHRSGLPGLPPGLLRHAPRHRADPYAELTTDGVLEALGRTRLRAEPGERFRYSNFGAGLLGLAMAHTAGVGYERLVADRITRPLGLADTVISLDDEQRARFVPGTKRRGRPAGPWTIPGLAGAGALRSTAADMIRFLRAQMGDAQAGTADDLVAAIAATHRERARGERLAFRLRIGLGWLLMPMGREKLATVWHNGGTGGYRSWVGFSPATRTGVVVLSANTRGVDPSEPGPCSTWRPGPDRLVGLVPGMGRRVRYRRMVTSEVALEQRVIELLAEVTGAGGALDLDSSLGALGVDSLAYAELAGLVEERLGLHVADEPVHGLSTVGALVALVEAAPGSSGDGSAVPDGLGRYQVAADVTASRLIRRWFDLKVRGGELMPGSGPVILCMNHESLLDVPVAVAASPRPVSFMAKRELFRNRVGGWFLHELGGFSVDRDSFDLRAIRTALAVLAQGEVLGMYPEGTRKPGELLPFLHGPAWLALRTGAPLLPAAIKGTEAAMPPGQKLPKRVPVEVIFDPPIEVVAIDDPAERLSAAGGLTARLRAVFVRLLA